MVRKSNNEICSADETCSTTSDVTPENVTMLEGGKSNVSFQFEPKKPDQLRNRASKMNSVVRQLENSLLESQQNDRQLLLTVQRDDVRNQKLSYQLEEARKENKQLLNVFQKQNSSENLSRLPSSRTQSDVSSYSTISMVHLQYKYEELLSSHEGLLKVLETKAKECQKCYRENEKLCDEIETLSLQVANNHKTINTLCEKYLHLKQRKDSKISALRYERETLRLAHNQVVGLLHKKCMDDDHFLVEELQKSNEPMRSLLIKEIRHTNKLQHENSRLQQENTFLKSHLNALKKIECFCHSPVTNSD